MANTKTTIELNGTMYDAVTGRPVTGYTTSARPQASQPVQASRPASGGMSTDGFVRSKTTTRSPVTPQPAKMRRPERSKTLMRHAMTRPTVAASAKPVDKPAPAKHSAALPAAVNKERQLRAEQTRKSPTISRFGAASQAKVEKKVVHHMPVQAPPLRAAMEPPEIAAPEPVQALPAVSFTDAIANARSHEQAKLEKPKLRHRTAQKLGTTSRVVSVGAVSLAVLLLAGFIGYQNVPNFQMRLAATRAGFNASLPVTPSGFSMGGVQSSPGQVTVSFRSNSDNRSFQVTQKESDWTSSALLDSYVMANKLPYQTYEDKGKTIYIYDGSNATWVNGGVWYEIKGSSDLNSDQLVQIANSF